MHIQVLVGVSSIHKYYKKILEKPDNATRHFGDTFMEMKRKECRILICQSDLRCFFLRKIN
jgi:hypothetical protein